MLQARVAVHVGTHLEQVVVPELVGAWEVRERLLVDTATRGEAVLGTDTVPPATLGVGVLVLDFAGVKH